MAKGTDKIKDLKSRLRSTGPLAEAAAQEALERKGEVADALFDDIRAHKVPAVRKILVKAIPKLRPDEVVDLLRGIALDDDDEGVAADAALGLVALKPTTVSLNALVDLILTGRGRWTKRDAGRPPRPWHIAREQAFALVEKKHALLPHLLTNASLLMELETDLLESSNVEERKRAARILGEIGATSKVSVLLQALEDRGARALALESLVSLKAELAVAPAKEVLLTIKDEAERAQFQKSIRALERKTAK